MCQRHRYFFFTRCSASLSNSRRRDKAHRFINIYGMAASLTFLYFAYGSNLFRERLVLANPSAVYRGFGKLEGFKLVFYGNIKVWQGGVASIEETDGDEVWGTVWQLDMADLPSLDRQEKMYIPIEVTIKTTREEGGERQNDTAIYRCRTYQMLQGLERNAPSPHYKDIIVRGARQSKLPLHYLDFLEGIPDNGFQGDVPVYNDVMKLLLKG